MSGHILSVLSMSLAKSETLEDEQIIANPSTPETLKKSLHGTEGDGFLFQSRQCW